jgi:hypothetical protein
MGETKPCQHCNGTTYCGARRDETGKLKLRTACTTCVFKSALDPRVVYSMVVCSVCKGTGKEPEAPAPQAKATPPWLYAVWGGIAVAALAVAVFGGIAFERERNRL